MAEAWRVALLGMLIQVVPDGASARKVSQIAGVPLKNAPVAALVKVWKPRPWASSWKTTGNSGMRPAGVVSDASVE